MSAETHTQLAVRPSTTGSTANHKAIPRRPLATMLRYNRPYWKSYAGGTLAGTVSLSVTLATPLVFSALIEGFEKGTMTPQTVWHYFYALVVIAAGAAFARYWQRIFIGRASRHFEFDLRNDYFRHVQGLSQEFFNRTMTGDIMARATNDLNFVRLVVGQGMHGAIDIFRLPITIAVLLYFSVELTLDAALVLPLAAIASYFILRYTHRQSRVVQERFSTLTAKTQENLAGARVVKAYGVAKREIEGFGQESDRYILDNLRLATVQGLMGPLISLAIRITLVLVIWQGGMMVIHHDVVSRPVWENGALTIQTLEMTLGALMGFVVCLMMLGGPITNFGMVISFYQRGAAGMNRIAEIFAETPDIQDDEETDDTVEVLHGGIRFDHVSFQYRGHTVLRDISWEIQPGQTLAVVGPTGSGKSTIMSLLTRQYDPTEGAVLFDGIDARTIPLRVLRKATGFVPQDTFLFSDTIRANLSVGRPETTQDELDQACRIAQFDQTLAGMEKGYETLLGERGVNLSGGQKQRLTIARALIQDPAILLLDDALSSVDTRTEEQILRGLRDVMATRTNVLVSHRVSTVRHADLILVLDDGAIVERGTHEQLLAHNGLYADMYERQTLEEELEDE